MAEEGSLATFSKMPEGASSSEGWTGMADGIVWCMAELLEEVWWEVRIGLLCTSTCRHQSFKYKSLGWLGTSERGLRW